MIKSTSCPELLNHPSNKKAPLTIVRGGHRSSTQLSLMSSMAASTPQLQQEVPMPLDFIEFYSTARVAIPSVMACNAPKLNDSQQEDFDIASCLATPVEGPAPQDVDSPTISNVERWAEWIRRMRRRKIGELVKLDKLTKLFEKHET